MKKYLALLLCCLMMLPVCAWAQTAAEPIVITYNGQPYEYTYTSLAKCCNEGDNSHQLIFKPIGDSPAGTVTLTFPTSVASGDQFSFKRGEGAENVLFYANGENGIRNYVTLPGSLLGTGMVGEGDFFELTLHSVEVSYGVAHVDATLRGSFLNGEDNYEIHFQVQLLMT